MAQAMTRPRQRMTPYTKPNMPLTHRLPVIKARSQWRRILHSHFGAHLRCALERHRGIAVVEVPFDLTA